MTGTIGIMGSGMIGGQVARLAVKAGLNVVICNSRGPKSLGGLITELGPKARAATMEDVAESCKIIVLAVPFGIYSSLPVAALAGKTLVDTMNYYPQRDGVMSEVKSAEISTSELVQRQLATSKIVRALNNMDFRHLFSMARPAGAPDRSAMPVAADDAAAKANIIALLDRLGYDSVDMGSLSDSWRSAPTMPVYVRPYQQYAVVGVAMVRTLLVRAVRHANMAGGY